MDRICKNCKKNFLKTRKNRGNWMYCSRKCYSEDHHVLTNCAVCNTEFRHHKTKKRRFCGISCSNKSRYEIILIPCKVCGTNFRKSNDNSFFCSNECYNKSGNRSKNKVRDKNPNFIRGKFSYRKYALRELPNECIICKKTEKLDAHHIDENRENNELYNLAILCHSCHMKYHHNTLEFTEL